MDDVIPAQKPTDQDKNKTRETSLIATEDKKRRAAAARGIMADTRKRHYVPIKLHAKGQECATNAEKKSRNGADNNTKDKDIKSNNKG